MTSSTLQESVDPRTGMTHFEMKQFVRNHFEEFVNRKYLNIGNLNFAPEFIDHGADVPPGLAPGPAGAMQYVGGAYKKFPDIHVEILDLIAEDDKVVVRNHWTGTEAASSAVRVLGNRDLADRPPATGRAVGLSHAAPDGEVLLSGFEGFVKPTLFLRIASVLTFVHCVLHTFGGVLSSPRHGAEEVAVIESMKSHSFDVMGSMRSYWDFFFGYGLLVTIFLLADAVLFWQLASLAKAHPIWMRPIIALFSATFAATAVVAWKYFFLGPAITELLIATCLAMAFFGTTA